jgi:hypothetical protein
VTIIVNQQLFATAYLRELLEAQAPIDAVAACQQTIREWRSEYASLDNSTNLLSYVAQCFGALGLSYARHDHPDRFLLYGDETHRQPLGICLAVVDEQIGRTTKGRHYQAQLISLLREQHLSWGIITNGREWRLCHANADAPYETYLECMIDAMLDEAHLADFLLYYRCFGRLAFGATDVAQTVAVNLGEAPAPRQGLDALLEASQKRTEAIERHLKARVDDVLQRLCLGFVASDVEHTHSRSQLDAIYNNAIYLLYRMLFLFYAEARGLLPIDDERYRRVSLAAIVEDARRPQQEGRQWQGHHDFWERLSRLCVIVDDGDAELGVYPYNGGLFSDTEKPYLRNHYIADEYLAPALFDLAYETSRGGTQQIDYRDLSVRHLGTLYEGLLEYRLNVVDREPVVVRESGGKYLYIAQSEAGPIKKGETILPVGQVYFADDKGERKASGSYYTPEDVVCYIVTNTVMPKLAQRRADILDPLLAEVNQARVIAVTNEERRRVERYADRQVLDFVEREILSVRILDPAMGSGHFLVSAGQAVANTIVEMLNSTPWANDAVDCDPLRWKRRVVEHCLYGVDRNHLAQELAKLSLWISSASTGKPLTFLDHHLKVGNALYGTPLARLAALPTTKTPKPQPLFDTVREAMVGELLRDARAITTADSDDIVAVKHKGTQLQAVEAKMVRLRDIANVWLASLFGLTTSEGQPLSEAEFATLRDGLMQNGTSAEWEAYVKSNDTLNSARRIARDALFFHWELEFPDTLVNERCCFDVIVANPPYVGMKANPAIVALFATAPCGDIYAWFVERALGLARSSGSIGTIIPLSITFSRQFKSLRRSLLQSEGITHIASFDATRDGIFPPSGESRNGQRVSIVTHHKQCGIRQVYATNYDALDRRGTAKALLRPEVCRSIRARQRGYIPEIGRAIPRRIPAPVFDI